MPDPIEIRETLCANEWLSLNIVRKPEVGVNGYVYSHETRCQGRIVAVLPYRDTIRGREYLIKSEMTPCWGFDQVLSSITGGYEGGDIEDDAVREVLEETGYTIARDELIPLGESYASKSADTVYTLFSVDLTGREQGEANGDGSRVEAESASIWLHGTVLGCIKDPQVAVMYLRLDGPKPGFCCQDAYASSVRSAGTEVLHTSGCPNRCSKWVPTQRPDTPDAYPCALTAGHLGDCWLHPDYRAPAAGEAYKFISDLDRCKHGRHAIDSCWNCPGGQSAGNPHLRPGQVVGYDYTGRPYAVPVDGGELCRRADWLSAGAVARRHAQPADSPQDGIAHTHPLAEGSTAASDPQDGRTGQWGADATVPDRTYREAVWTIAAILATVGPVHIPEVVMVGVDGKEMIRYATASDGLRLWLGNQAMPD